MTKSTRRTTFSVDRLETRSLLSGFAVGAMNPPSAAVAADLLKIKADRAALQAEIQTLTPTLQADNKAIQAAITNSPTVQLAKTTLTADLTKSKATIKADILAIIAAPDAASRTADITKLQTDATAAYTLIKADGAGVDAAIKADKTVQSAISQLTTDSVPITKDQATLQADYAQLQADLKA